MAGGKLLTKALQFLSPQSSPLHHLRRLSTGGNLNPSPAGNSVHHFLRCRGMADEALAGFPPRLLDSKVGNDFPANFDQLLTCGFSVSEAAKVLRINHLNISTITLRRRLDTLRSFVAGEADLRRIIHRARWVLGSDRQIHLMAENVSKLRGWGVSVGKMKSLLVACPRFFLLKPERVDEAADRAEAEFGFRRDSKMFVYAVIVLWRVSESSRQSKLGVFESFGWERSDIMALFKLYPYCITLAEANLVKKLAFFMNELGFGPSSIAKHPPMLGYSMEKRVRPRFELVNALKSKNLLPEEPCFLKIWSLSESEFMKKYVVKFMKQESVICNTYINTVASSKQQTTGFVNQSLSLSEA